MKRLPSTSSLVLSVVTFLSVFSIWQSSQSTPPTVPVEVEARLVEQISTQVFVEVERQHEQGTRLPTATPGRGGTATPTVVGTSTPIATATFTLTPGPSPTPGAVVIDDNLPACSDAQHNSGVWHSLVLFDEVGNPLCHFDHEHKENPFQQCAVDKFGLPGATNNQPEIGYFFETKDENLHKHEAYSYIVRCDLPKVEITGEDDGNPNYVKTIRLQYHADPIPFYVNGIYAGGYIGSQHSYYIELEICRKSDEKCGILSVGGWVHTGPLELRDKFHPAGNPVVQCAPLPDLVLCKNGPGGNKIHFDNLDFDFPNVDFPIPLDQLPRGVTEFWYGEPSVTFPPASVEIVHPMILAITQGDIMTDVQLSTLMTPYDAVYCPDMQCWLNGSTFSLHEISMNLKQGGVLDPDNNGFVDAFLLVDQHLRNNSECMAAGEVTSGGLMCIPFRASGVPTGKFEFGDNEELGLSAAGLQDYDLSPAQTGTGTQWWITWAVDLIAQIETMDH